VTVTMAGSAPLVDRGIESARPQGIPIGVITLPPGIVGLGGLTAPVNSVAPKPKSFIRDESIRTRGNRYYVVKSDNWSRHSFLRHKFSGQPIRVDDSMQCILRRDESCRAHK
jgi:hypothetical protein